MLGEARWGNRRLSAGYRSGLDVFASGCTCDAWTAGTGPTPQGGTSAVRPP